MKPARDLRKFASETRLRLITGGLGLVFVVGLTLIGVLYGSQAAWLGLLCLLAAFLPVGMVMAALWLFDWISKHG